VKAFGIALIVLSALLWIALLGVPFLPFSVLIKGGIVTMVLVIAEVIFWLGCLLAGAEWAKRVWERWGGGKTEDRRR